jgi:hypothetical protein
MENKHYQTVHKYDFLTKELLQEEYVAKGLTDKQIAEKYNIPSKTVVWKKRKKFGIENKFKNKSNKNATKNRKFDISKEDAENFLAEGKTFEEISESMGCSIIVAKRRFKELGLSRKQKQTSSYEYYNVELSDPQKQMIIGSLLGDGTITKSGAYSCSHSIKQKAYFDYKMSVLYNLHSNCSQKYAHNYEWLKNKTESLHFTTGCNKYLYEMREIYYPYEKKIFPYDHLMKNIKEEGLAYWYCDDGCFNNKSSRLCTYGYSHDEQQLMVKLLKEKFNIDSSIYYRRSRNDYFIQLNIEETKKFISMIRPYVVPSMLYKIGEKKKKK